MIAHSLVRDAQMYCLITSRVVTVPSQTNLACSYYLHSVLKHYKSSLIVVILMVRYLKLSLLESFNPMALLWPEELLVQGMEGCAHVCCIIKVNCSSAKVAGWH